MDPQLLLTDEEYLELMRLLDAQGSVTKVAEILKLPEEEIRKHMEAYPELKALVGELEPPKTGEEDGREPLTPLIKTDSGKVVERMRKMDDMLEPALEEMGLAPHLARRMRLLRDYGRDRFTDLRQMVGGGMVVNLARLNEISKALFDKLDDPTLEKAERALITSQLDVILEHLHKVTDRAQHSALIEAKIKAAEDGKNREKRHRRPGFRPLVAIQTEKVTVKDGNAAS